MSVCYLVEDRCLYLNSFICILLVVFFIEIMAFCTRWVKPRQYSSALPKCLHTKFKVVLKYVSWQLFVKVKGENSYLLSGLNKVD